MRTVIITCLSMLCHMLMVAQANPTASPPASSNPQVIIAPIVVTQSPEKPKEEQPKPKKTDIPFGKKFEHSITLSGADNYIYKVELLKLDKKKSKLYYNSNDQELFKSNSSVVYGMNEISWSSSDNKTFKMTIPPIKANAFYQLKIDYFEGYNNIYAAFLLMHEEGNGNWFYQKKKWMTMIDAISELNAPNHIYFDPTLDEVNRYDREVSSILNGDDINSLSLAKMNKIRDKTYEIFPILNFSRPNDYVIMNYAEFVVAPGRESLAIEEQLGTFSKLDPKVEYFNAYIDYINIYNFYDTYLKDEFDQKELSIFEVIELVNASILEQRDKITSGFIPNYLNNFDAVVSKTSESMSTYTESFETAYKRVLVPDFGLITYNPGLSGSVRGLPFVGVNISLAPVNKNVPLELSDLSFWQRCSIHTGVTVGSLAESNRRENFFNNASLMIGGSYKFGTQATRINFGGLLYNKIDPISGDKSFSITPYVGISIDIEIRKWLSEIIPGYAKKFE